MKERNGRGQFRATETLNYKKKLQNHFGDFEKTTEEAFMEAALEKYDFSSSACPKGEKMVFGKCQKTGGSSDDTQTASVRGKRNLNRLDNQRRRESGLKSKSSKKGFKHK